MITTVTWLKEGVQKQYDNSLFAIQQKNVNIAN